MDLRLTIREGWRWGVSAVGGLLANLALLTLWVDGVGVPAWAAIGINWLLLSVTHYAVADRWVFAQAASATSVRGHVRQFSGMQAIMTSGKLVNYLLYLGLLRVVDYRIAWTVGAVVVFCWSFGANRKWWARQSNGA
jgi:putative flippase GtrA